LPNEETNDQGGRGDNFLHTSGFEEDLASRIALRKASGRFAELLEEVENDARSSTRSRHLIELK